MASVCMKNLLLLLPLCGLLGCHHQNEPTPDEQLPPATQTGANTFGCLINSQAWTPRGNNGYSNYSIAVDPTYHGGTIDIRAYRYTDNLLQSIILGGDSLKATGTYSLALKSRSIFFTDKHLPLACQNFDGRTGQYRRGTLTITRLDLQAGIISGTFSFTLYQPGCDSVRVTQGRFDKRL
jgi:hypothetical protein